MIKVGIIGYGYWGPNLVRNFSSIPFCKVKTVADLRSERLKLLKQNYPTVGATRKIDDIFSDKEIDAVIIATPVSSHFELGKKALLSGKHVLLEKPLCASVAEANKLIDLSEKTKKTLMVDHTYLYTGAIKKVKEIIQKKDIGKIKYFDSTRINLGLFQQDVNVLWDLAPHDIAILSYLLSRRPLSVQALGMSHLKNGIEDVAYLFLRYHSGLIAHFSCSWSSPIKVRTMMIGGDKKMVVWNDMEPTEKIKIYDSGYFLKSDEDKKRILIDYRVGDIYVPKIEIKEALREMALDFLSSIMKKTEPISNYKIGLEVVKILEMSQKSIKNKGKEIKYS